MKHLIILILIIATYSLPATIIADSGSRNLHDKQSARSYSKPNTNLQTSRSSTTNKQLNNDKYYYNNKNNVNRNLQHR